MYLRPVRISELVEWLINNEFHTLQADDLATKLVNKFDILTLSKEAA